MSINHTYSHMLRTAATRQYRVAILGATGLVGRMAIQLLAERCFPVSALYLLASERSEGESLLFKDERLPVLNAADFNFSGVDFAIFSAGEALSRQYAPIATAAGCVVIDNTIAFRYDEDVPLIVPEVNLSALSLHTKRGIIANPNCSTIQLAVALKPLYDAVGITEVEVATYQSVSGAGTLGIQQLRGEMAATLQEAPIVLQAGPFPVEIACNVIPFIDSIEENGFSKEEMKLFWEMQKLFADPNLKTNATAVRVPVMQGHAEAVSIRTKVPLSVETAYELWQQAPGVYVFNNPKQYPTPRYQGEGTDLVQIGRVRQHLCTAQGLSFWVVADNLRKGAALNAVQIMEALSSFAQA